MQFKEKVTIQIPLRQNLSVIETKNDLQIVVICSYVSIYVQPRSLFTKKSYRATRVQLINDTILMEDNGV